MKKILALLAASFLCLGAFAQESVPKESEWDFLNFTIVPGVPPAEQVPSVVGVKVGLPMGFSGGNYVSGVEASVFGSMTPYVYGVQCAILFDDATEVDGLQASFIYNQADRVKGLQFSIINYATDSAFQVGILNIIKNSPLPIMIGCNFRFAD